MPSPIRCVISTSFADIFYNNCFKNGILPVIVWPGDLEKLMDDAQRGSNATLTVDLEKQEVRGPDGGVVRFEMDPFRKKCLMEGLDDIGLTMQKADNPGLRGAGRARPPLGLIPEAVNPVRGSRHEMLPRGHGIVTSANAL